MLAIALCLLLWAASTPSLAAASYCDALAVPECAKVEARDILFLVDGSNSMDENRFYADVLNYTLTLYCAFQEDQPNKAGMILFNSRVEVIIPIKAYTRTQWYNKVWEVKNTQGTANPACCSCCTPTGDAFQLALTHFLTVSANPAQMTFVITDGVPSNNQANTGGNATWWWFDPATGFDPAVYNTQIVPQQATALKNAGIRVILVGVPNYNGVAPDQKYFDGSYSNGYNYCLTRQNVKFCAKYYTKNPENFPLVSLPVSQNSFTTNVWNSAALLTSIINSVCYQETTSPTKSPTLAPTKAPTKAPTRAPTTQGPTSKAPTPAPTTLAPSFAPTKAPTMLPTSSPTKPVLEQVDLTFIVDRSRSMTYNPQLCQKIIDTFPPDGHIASTEPCWELWTKYVENQATDMTKIPAGVNNARLLGWADDFAASTPAKGLRVNIFGFACEGHQKIPKQFDWSQDINGGPITNAADFLNVIQVLRETVLPHGGTCPHLAVEQAIKQLETTEASTYPLQGVILMTDGVFYDGDAVPKATTGLDAYKALKFAVGIQVAQDGKTFGLTPEEIAQQQQQLSDFVNGDDQYFYNLANGYDGLLGISETLAAQITQYYFNKGMSPIPRYTWCGFRRLHNCESDNYRAKHCKWTGGDNAQYKCQVKKKYA